MGRLSQQFVVDAWVKVEHSRLYFVEQNQDLLRTEMYRGLMDHLVKKTEDSNTKIGKMVILPSSFTGSPRACKENYLDSMTLVQSKGKPDLFITMTCNSAWSEISDNMRSHESTLDRPDLIVRVFHEKLKAILNDITKQHIFGEWVAYTIVKKFMIHGPCGEENVFAVCMDPEKQICTKKFPKSFVDSTIYDTTGYPLYKRSRSSNIIIYNHKNGRRIADNRFVVPYNPYLLLKYNCHINVEVCTTVLCIKYLFKYCYKGHDCALIEMTNTRKDESEEVSVTLNHDEIKSYINTRYACPPEAVYRINKYKMNDISHAIIRLAIHNEDEQNVYFKDGCETEVLTKNVETTLTSWFTLNKEDPKANNLLYTDIPYQYVYENKKWKTRKRMTKPIISRMYLVSPKQKERYYLRILLLHTRGAKSFDDLKTFDGIKYNTYLEVVRARNLIKIDNEWDLCLAESVEIKFPHAICELFAFICIHHNPINSRDLYDKYKSTFYFPHMSSEDGENWALGKIQLTLQNHGYELKDFNLPDITTQECVDYNNEESVTDLSHQVANVKDVRLTQPQEVIFNTIVESLRESSYGKLIFIHGPGGSGKSFLLNYIINYMIEQNVEVLPVAWTGIAANLLKNGKTSHIAFKLPLDITSDCVCNVSPNSIYGDYLRQVKIIIWDEISMASKDAFEAVSRLLKDVSNNDKLFGGKVIVVAGDFRQTLPIVRHGTKAHIIANCVKHSSMWHKFRSFALFENKRLKDKDEQFQQWLLNIGDGIFKNQFEKETESILVPEDMLCTKESLVDQIYGTKIDVKDMRSRHKVILAPTNADVIELNKEILSIVEGKPVEYLSIDVAVDDNNEEMNTSMPVEFLNTLTPNGLPPHNLTLKVGAIVILLRNLNINNGLCNGTRLKIKTLMKYSIFAEVVSGNAVGSSVIIPRIDLTPANGEIPFKLVRRQLPVRLGYAMTINKSQGQSFEKVGVLLPALVFGHGQLYVALSRVRSRAGIKVVLQHNNVKTHNNARLGKRKIDQSSHYTKNVVYKEIL
uniref:ATP-dependent DNA helicase n=1 Tax=Trichogramma kaykai TaxID=54128 RepID=A0ABD2WQT2_9HYME